MDFVVSTIAERYREVHQQLRQEIGALDAAALLWTPGPETNSAAVLIVHTLGSEAEVWWTVSGTPAQRDRPAEFVPRHAQVDDLLARLDAADALVAKLSPRLSQQDLQTVRPRGDRTPQTGLHWLITNYGHAREHLAHIQLTLQLYGQRRQPTAS